MGMSVPDFFRFLVARSQAILKAAGSLRVIRRCLEGIASGYWTPSDKRSSGLISHCGSSPLPSVRLLGLQ